MIDGIRNLILRAVNLVKVLYFIVYMVVLFYFIVSLAPGYFQETVYDISHDSTQAPPPTNF